MIILSTNGIPTKIHPITLKTTDNKPFNCGGIELYNVTSSPFFNEGTFTCTYLIISTLSRRVLLLVIACAS